MAFSALLHGAISPNPVFPEWNLRILQILFRLLPHTEWRDGVAQFFVGNLLSSTWIYAAVFYIYWRLEDQRTLWRRTQLLALVAAFCVVVPATLALRPWVGWPAPSLSLSFRQLFPEYLWNQGEMNCFPSHSTLACVLVAAGLWPFSRRLSGVLMLIALLIVSLPRIYTGGHYPIDVVVGILLALIGTWLARQFCAEPRTRVWLERAASTGLYVEVFIFLWLFELGEGFRSSYWIWTSVQRMVRGGH